ncbi:glycosyl hydrolase family 7 domain-containing protein [Sarocladium implicatum]|nr:glycosyl hydrolase family 7 domain-containing protein [Sarocladium implicatum]
MLSLAILSLAAAVRAQKVGTQQTETHPKLSWSKCSSGGSCQTQQGEVVIDSNWRWLHTTQGTQNCYDGNKWTSACSGESDCTTNCALEGADYGKTYGVSTSGNQLSLTFSTTHDYGTNIGSRLYLMQSTDAYQMFTLSNNELAFDVDLSTVECGLNSALYFVAMESDGGKKSYSTNQAGAKYGTGYCDAQCARDLKFVGGKANVDGWKPSSNDANAGVGKYGACCAEIDIWESNAHSFAFTPHPCENNNYHVCQDKTCGGTYSDDRFAGLCDANGCDYNPYRMGNTNFYGKGLTVDTSKKFTVVTQFTSQKLTQFLVQGGKKFEIPAPTYDGISDTSDITAEFCENQFEVFGDRNRFSEVGGWSQLQKALSIPMVLVMSIWDDHYANMLWLDSIYPPEKEGTPGAARGDCPQDSGVPADVESQYAKAKVIWSNIRFGPVGSTVKV